MWRARRQRELESPLHGLSLPTQPRSCLAEILQRAIYSVAAMVRLLARVMGIGIETADMLVHEVLSRNLRDRPRARD
jgi:hypothetical protein